MSSQCLEANLQEIASASLQSFDPNQTDLPLVANIFGTHLYHANVGWGRFWVWFYRVAEVFVGAQFASEKLISAINHTIELFQEKYRKMNEWVQIYQTNIQRISSGRTGCVTGFNRAHKKITKWNRTISPFFHYADKGKCRKQFSLLLGDRCIDLAQPLQPFIDYERRYKKSVPWLLLTKVFDGKELSIEENKTMRRFLPQLSSEGCCGQMTLFSDVIFNYLTHITKQPEKFTDFVVTMLKVQPQFIAIRDEAHILWRDSLQPGDIITCNGDSYTIEARLGEAKLSMDDGHVVFSLVAEPDKVALVGINRLTLPLKKDLSDEQGCGLRHAKMVDVDKGGRVALVEKLITRFIDSEPLDRDRLAPVARLVKWMIKEEFSPSRFFPSHLMYDKEGVLRTTRAWALEELNITKLEDFLFACARNHEHDFNYLMILSGLSQHASAKYYRDVVSDALDEKKTDLSSLAAVYRITDWRIVARGQKLYQDVIEYKKLKMSELDLSEAGVSQFINQIKDKHRQNGSPSFLWDLVAAASIVVNVDEDAIF